MTWDAEYPQKPATMSDGLEHVYQLWLWYYEEAERFDRGVCTGPMVHGSAMPATEAEQKAILVHARDLMVDIRRWVARYVEEGMVTNEDVTWVRSIARDEVRK
jgi:hypothetical protein